MIHSASPQSRPAVIVAWFWSFGTDGRTDGRTLCVKIVITTGRDCGRPCGSTRLQICPHIIQTHSLASSEHCFFTLFSRFWKEGTDGRTTCAKTIIPIGRDCGLAEWINNSENAYVYCRPLLNCFIEKTAHEPSNKEKNFLNQRKVLFGLMK